MKKFTKLSTTGIKNCCNNTTDRMEYKWRQRNLSAWQDINERHGVKKSSLQITLQNSVSTGNCKAKRQK